MLILLCFLYLNSPSPAAAEENSRTILSGGHCKLISAATSPYPHATFSNTLTGNPQWDVSAIGISGPYYARSSASYIASLKSSTVWVGLTILLLIFFIGTRKYLGQPRISYREMVHRIES